MQPSGSTEVPASASDGGEPERTRELASYDLDSLADDAALTEIADFAAELSGAPMALVTIVEEQRQLFIAKKGLDVRETPVRFSLCAHAMLNGSLLEVPDASADPRFADNPLVTDGPQFRFYAGQPLISQDGIPLGALCVVDHKPRPEGLNPVQRSGLALMARAIMLRLRSHRDGLLRVQEAEQAAARTKAVADSIPDIAWSAGPDGNPNYFNKRWYEYSGANKDDDRRTGEVYIHPDDYPSMRRLWDRGLRSGKPFEYEHRMLRRDGEYRWMLTRAVSIRDSNGKIIQWFGTVTDIDDNRRLSESRDLLAKELSHRIKNIFAVISGLISISARNHPEHKPYADVLSGTIQALARAHEFVRPIGEAVHNNLHALMAELFAPYGTGESARVRVSGDDFTVSSRAATPLALVFYELATNAAKYGALANPGGHVELTVADRGESLEINWVEHGGNMPVGEPEPGFGSRLVEMSVTGQLDGEWERRFEPGGMVARLTIAKATISG